MKIRKKHVLLLIIISSLIYYSCPPYNLEMRKDDTIYLRFAQINFGGDWSLFYNSNFSNYLRITLPSHIYASGQNPIQVNEYIEYDFFTKKFSQPGYNPNNTYVFKPRENDPIIETIYTEFRRFDKSLNLDYEGPIISIYSPFIWANYYDLKLTSGQLNTIAINLNGDSLPASDFYVDLSGYPNYTMFPEDRHFNFNVNVTHVKKAINTRGVQLPYAESINIAVIADGYNQYEIASFNEYVIDAFQSPAHFHYTEYNTSHTHVSNDFFERNWDMINVFMFETISPDSGIDTIKGRNSKKNFFDLNSVDRGPGNLFRMQKVISANYYKTQLHPDEVDVYIILVNNNDIWAYTYAYAYAYEIGNGRNGQPVYPIIIQAPAYNNVYDYFFHMNPNAVKTDAIAHELGHALARLIDEYDYKSSVSDLNLREYQEYFRNISALIDGKVKWQRFIDNGYLSPNPYQDLTNQSDNLLVLYYNNPHFYIPGTKILDKYFIPTVNSTMRGEHYFNRNYQFGPVNTYHMEGTFRTRVSPYRYNDFNDRNYEWPIYTFNQFTRDWLSSDFK